jgi:hypothetical protein
MVDITKEDYKTRLGPLRGKRTDQFEAVASKVCVSRRVVMVPVLVNGHLRIKTVQTEEWEALEGVIRGGQESVVNSACGKWQYSFGFEPYDLSTPGLKGFMVSSWEVSGLVTDTTLTYEFGGIIIQVFKEGFGKRGGTRKELNLLVVDGKRDLGDGDCEKVEYAGLEDEDLGDGDCEKVEYAGLEDEDEGGSDDASYGGESQVQDKGAEQTDLKKMCSESDSSGCLNVYNKDDGTGSSRPQPSPVVPDTEVNLQQYFRKTFRYDLARAQVNKVLEKLTVVIKQFACVQNPHLMQMVEDTCNRSILTTGSVPRSKVFEGRLKIDRMFGKAEGPSACEWALTKEISKMKKREKTAGRGKKRLKAKLKRAKEKLVDLKRKREGAKRVSVCHKVHGKVPPYGFNTTSHLDTLDELTGEQKQEWSRKALQNRWGYCQKLLEHQDFCLPTTCGYQFCFKTPHHSQTLAVKAYFSMEGLGMAMKLEHGIGHHFMGSTFVHHTCIALVENTRTGELTAANYDDNFLLVAWGTNGGRNEVFQKKRRQEAPTIARLQQDKIALLEDKIALQEDKIALHEKHIALQEKYVALQEQLLAAGITPL